MSISRFFRVLLSFLLFLVGLAIIIPIAGYFFFDPNHFKNEISSYISSKTGLPLEIHGKISVQVFPWVGLNVHQVDLAQPSAFGQGKMIEIEELGLKMPLNDLLHKQLNIESLVVNGVKIHAIKNKDGSTNWQYYTKQLQSKQSEATPAHTNSTAKTPHDPEKLHFALLQFAVNDANISYTDKQADQQIVIEKLQLQGQQGKSATEFPIEGSIALQFKDKDPALSFKSQGQFSGTVQEAKNRLLAKLKMDFSVDMPNNPEKFRQITITTQINADTAKAIELQDINVKSGPMDVRGQCKIPMNSQQAITFKLAINQLDLQALQDFAPKTTKIAAASNDANIVLVKQVQTSAKQKSSQALQGEVSIGKVLAYNLVLDNVHSNVKKDAATLTLRDLSATLYQGKLITNVTKNLQNPQAPVALQGKLTQISLAPLLKDLKQEARLSGVTNVDFNLTHHDTNGLNGSVKLQVADGVIEGIDVKYYLSVAQSLLKKSDAKESDSKRTPFGNLQATLLFNNHVMDNNDLVITSPDFTAKGEGSINLNSQTIAYKMQAIKTYQDGKEHKNAYPLAIRIKGPLAHPKVEPDFDVYVKKLMAQEVKGELNKQLDKKLGKLLGVPPAEEGANAQGDETKPQNLEDAARKKLEEKLEKGLKKLFK